MKSEENAIEMDDDFDAKPDNMEENGNRHLFDPNI